MNGGDRCIGIECRQDISFGRDSPLALTHRVTPPTAHKWLGRFVAGAEPALVDASSRPARMPHRFTRAYGPQTSGKAERFIQWALHE